MGGRETRTGIRVFIFVIVIGELHAAVAAPVASNGSIITNPAGLGKHQRSSIRSIHSLGLDGDTMLRHGAGEGGWRDSGGWHLHLGPQSRDVAVDIEQRFVGPL